MSKGQVLSVKMFILDPLCFAFPLAFSVRLSVAQTELARSFLLPLSASGSDKTVLSTRLGPCYAENLVYGPSTEYMCPFQSPTTTETVQGCSSLSADISRAAGAGLQLKPRPLVFQILVASEVVFTFLACCVIER